MLVLVVYDIADDRRRLKLSNFLEGHGRRVQESVFECFISLDQMRTLHKKVQRKVEPSVDNVRFYWISAEAVERVLTIGSAGPVKPPDFYML